MRSTAPLIVEEGDVAIKWPRKRAARNGRESLDLPHRISSQSC